MSRYDSQLTDSRDVLPTRSGGTLYVHLTDPDCSAVVLKPLDVLPRKAIPLNTGADLVCRLDFDRLPPTPAPSDG